MPIPLNPVINTTLDTTGKTATVNLGGANACLVVYSIAAGATGTLPTLTTTIKGLTPDGANTPYTVLASTAIASGSAAVGTLLVHPAATASANVAGATALPPDIQIVTTLGGTTPAISYTVSVIPLK